MKKFLRLLAMASILCVASTARATPSTMVWAPSTAAFQGYLVPHITYDTYFSKGAGKIAPVDTGVTMGVLPFEKINAEAGFDLLLPGNDPLLLHGKIGTPEGALFDGAPGLALGIFGVGTTDATSYDMLYAQVGKTIPRIGGYVSVGGYYAVGKEALFRSSTGETNKAGFIGGITAPDLNVNLSWLKKIVLAGDVQTGRNVFGAGGLAVSFYFTDAIAVLTGPIFFIDSALQPGGSNFMWTVQLDVDLPLISAPAPVPAAPKI